MKSNQKGFSLVELLVVVIIIGIIAAIAIPSLLASRRAANEASAVSTLRTIHSAEVTYLATEGGNSKYGDLTDLGAAGLVDPILGAADAGFTKSGYNFTQSLVATTSAGYCAKGAPTAPNGTRTFVVSDTGVIYQSAAATPTLTCGTGTLTVGDGTPIQ